MRRLACAFAVAALLPAAAQAAVSAGAYGNTERFDRLTGSSASARI